MYRRFTVALHFRVRLSKYFPIMNSLLLILRVAYCFSGTSTRLLPVMSSSSGLTRIASRQSTRRAEVVFGKLMSTPEWNRLLVSRNVDVTSLSVRPLNFKCFFVLCVSAFSCVIRKLHSSFNFRVVLGHLLRVKRRNR